MERYADLTRRHYKGSKVVLLVYDCDDMDSLEVLKDFYDAAAIHAPGAIMILVRNKTDLEFQNVGIDEAFDKLCGGERRRHRNFACHMPTSARTGDGIDALCIKLGDLLCNAKPVAKDDGAFQVFKNKPSPTPTSQAPADTGTGSCC